MDRDAKRRLVEALILASPEPLSAARLADLVPRGKPGLMTELVAELNAEYTQQDRGFEIWEVAGGFQLRTRPDLANYVQQMHEQRPARLSRAALETLAIVAYRQPVTRAEIEHVRGVAFRRLADAEGCGNILARHGQQPIRQVPAPANLLQLNGRPHVDERV